jgi:hypothetical protein
MLYVTFTNIQVVSLTGIYVGQVCSVGYSRAISIHQSQIWHIVEGGLFCETLFIQRTLCTTEKVFHVQNLFILLSEK